MWELIRRLFQGGQSGAGTPASQGTPSLGAESMEPTAETPTEYVDRPLEQLYVEPDAGEDFDAECCERLLRAIAERGGKTVEGVLGITVSLEDFFEGNRCKHSIAANVLPGPPFDTAESWYNHLKHVRAQPGVHDVLVEISMVEPYGDGRLGSWPYADRIWVYASLDEPKVTELLAPLEPDVVRNAAVPQDDGWNHLKVPVPAPEGVSPYWAWWD